MKKAVGYCRFSTDMQREESIMAQMRAIDEFAKRESIEIVKYYKDQGQSGTSDNRDDFQLMMKEVKNIDYVIVHKFDRFARNSFDHVINERKLNNKGIKLVSVLEPVGENPESILTKNLLIGMNEYFSLNLSREVKKGHKENALQCKFNGGTPPLGYKIVDGFYKIDEEEAKIVEKIFALRLQNYSYQKIADTLNGLGYKNKYGKEFNRNSFYEMLQNKRYKGTYIYGVNDGSGEVRNYRKKNSEWVEIEDAIPAIITKEVWEEVNKKYRKRSGAFKKDARDYILSGLVFCEQCGAPMLGCSRQSSTGKKYYYYRCNDRCGSKSIRADLLEEVVTSLIRDHLIHEKNIDVIVDYVVSNYQLENPYLELQKQKNKLIRQRDNIVNLMAETGSKALIDKLEQLDRQIDNIYIPPFKQVVLDRDVIKKRYLQFLHEPLTGSMIRLLIKKIKVNDHKTIINLVNYPNELLNGYSHGAGKRT